MATIYDDVAELMRRMADAEGAISGLRTDVNNLGDLSELENDVDELVTRVIKVEQLGGTTLTTGADIHALGYGRYIVPTAAIASSLINAPSGVSGSTAVVDVIPGGGYGQKIVRYSLCDKEEVLYYEDTYYSNAWGGWRKVDLTDTGWIELPLAEGIESYGEGVPPEYRRIGNTVYIRGAVKSVSGTGLIATLPVGFRPVQSTSYVQNTSLTNNYAAFSRLLVGNNGQLKLEAISEGVTHTDARWWPIHGSFPIN